jgi:hypothetical protein
MICQTGSGLPLRRSLSRMRALFTVFNENRYKPILPVTIVIISLMISHLIGNTHWLSANV